MYLVVLLAVLGAACAQDYCYCVTRNRVNVRSTACGIKIGLANTNKCFKDLGTSRSCRLNGKLIRYRKIRFYNKFGWIAAVYLRRKRCPGSVKSEISQSCLNCICKVESRCTCNNCKWDVNSLSCGPYQIKEKYHKDCYKYDRSVISDWKTCTTGSRGNSCTNLGRAKSGSEKCVRAYTSRYGTYCTRGRQPTCEDYARIHNGGPKGCRYKSTIKYWRKVKACCDRTGGC